MASRYPQWVVGLVDLGGLVPEVLCWARRVILLDSGAAPEIRRSSLAHAVAHLDLGHTRTSVGYFENREERQADLLAARRLIPIDDLAEALAWSPDRGEVAALLGVDLPMLVVRERGLSAAEKTRLRRVSAGRGVPA